MTKEKNPYKKVVYLELILSIILLLVYTTGGVAQQSVDMSHVIGAGKNVSQSNSTLLSGNMVLLKTNYGDIKIELSNQTPITSGNFKKLVESGFYDGTRFHRVIDGFMIQGGDPLSKNISKKNLWGTGGSKNIPDEFVKGLSNVRGTIAMANTGQPNSASSQFFINQVDNTGLDFDKAPLSSKLAVFGKVVEGMDVVDKIAKVQTDSADRPTTDVIIEKAEMIN